MSGFLGWIFFMQVLIVFALWRIGDKIDKK